MTLAHRVATLNLLGDESRLRLCALLRERELSVGDLVRVTGLTANALWTTLEGGSPRAVLLRNADTRVVAPRQQAVSAALGPAVRVRP